MERLKILDGLRVVAIIMVMLFHYLYLYNGKNYELAHIEKSYFKYGYLGVQLFFIISGFVITLTLTKSTDYFVFLKKRWIRLFPGMLICSLITFCLISLLDYENLFPNSKQIVNLLVSNTFISPSLINQIFNVRTSYIDPPYWSLWVEIQFYIIIGIIYFLKRECFIRNFLFISVILSILFCITHNTNFIPFHINFYLNALLDVFNFSEYALWFAMGVLIYKLYFDKKNNKTFLLLIICVIMQLGFSNFSPEIAIFLGICILIFYSFLYNQKLLNFLTHSLLQKVGIASYAVYLLHQNLGILIMNKLYLFYGTINLYAPILIMISFVIIGVLIYEFFEKPIGRVLKNRFFKR